MTRRGIAPLAVMGVAALVALDLGLGATIWSLWSTPDEAVLPPAPRWTPPAELALPATPPAVPRSAERSVVLTRPLFSKTRRAPVERPAPPPVARPVAPPPPAPDPGFALTGVLISGDQRRAYITSRANPAGTWVAQGGKIENWTVAAITEGDVTLQSETGRVALSLYQGAR